MSRSRVSELKNKLKEKCSKYYNLFCGVDDFKMVNLNVGDKVEYKVEGTPGVVTGVLTADDGQVYFVELRVAEKDDGGKYVVRRLEEPVETNMLKLRTEVVPELDEKTDWRDR